jgi:uncharacterized protein YbjT (DUF2867 family)
MSSPKSAKVVLVTGAAGKTGLAVIGKFRELEIPVRALVHRRRHRQLLEGLGVEQVAEGDLTNRDAVGRAMSGVGSVYHICPNVHPEEIAIGRLLIEAARNADVEQFVFHSVLHPQIEAMPHHWAKLRVEELLFESGLVFTILQPAPYMQNLLGQWRSIVEEGVLPVPYGLGTRVAMIDLDDVAEAAVRVLTEARHENATYELCGPDLLDQKEIAAVLSQALGRSIRARVVALENWSERAVASGMSRYQVETLVSMFRCYERFGMAGGSAVLGWLLGRPPTSFAEFVHKVEQRAIS